MENNYKFNKAKWTAGMAAALQIAENYFEAILLEDTQLTVESLDPGENATSKQKKKFQKDKERLWRGTKKRLADFKSNHKGTLTHVLETDTRNEECIEALVDLYSGITEKAIEFCPPMLRINVGEPHVSIEKDLYVSDGGSVKGKKILTFNKVKKVLL